MEGIKDKVAIIGMGCTRFGELWEKGPDDLVIEAAYEAYADAGIEPKDLQAAWVGLCTGHPLGMSGGSLAEPLKLQRIAVTRVENFCASGLEALRNAVYGVASGAYDLVLAQGFEKLKDSGVAGLGFGRGVHPVREMRRTAPGTFALVATRYFHTYGLSPEEGKKTIAKIAVKNHYNGSLNPRAHMQHAVTLEQVLNSPIIAWPLSLFDCCGNSDGSAAAILCRADMAKNFRPDPVYIKALSLAVNPIIPHFEPGFDWTGFETSRVVSRDAYRQAGIKNPRKELDLAEVHDCFTITEMVIYEDFGFSPKGRAKEDIDAGTFSLKGELPVNSDGGLKSFGHPIGASGLRMTFEVYKQLQGKAEKAERQLKDPKLGLAHTLGGRPEVSCVAILGKELG